MTTKQPSLDLAVWIAQLIDKKGGQSISVLDVRKQSSVTDFYIVATGHSSTLRETLVMAPTQELKRSGFPPVLEGMNTPWIVADFNDVVLHVFDEPTRNYYDLEGLWKDAPRVDWTPKRSILSVAL